MREIEIFDLLNRKFICSFLWKNQPVCYICLKTFVINTWNVVYSGFRVVLDILEVKSMNTFIVACNIVCFRVAKYFKQYCAGDNVFSMYSHQRHLALVFIWLHGLLEYIPKSFVELWKASRKVFVNLETSWNSLQNSSKVSHRRLTIFQNWIGNLRPV